MADVSKDEFDNIEIETFQNNQEFFKKYHNCHSINRVKLSEQNIKDLMNGKVLTFEADYEVQINLQKGDE